MTEKVVSDISGKVINGYKIQKPIGKYNNHNKNFFKNFIFVTF